MDVDSGEKLLNVRETARRLEVHENTVRAWTRSGLLPDARLPGTRFHKFRESDVERLKAQRGSVAPSLEEERRTVGPELIDASQLSAWADTKDAQQLFPELMRRLLVASPGISNIAVRTGDGTAVPGWDGRAKAVGAKFLPDGNLLMEFGTGRNPKAKAESDYEKRKQDPDAHDSTFLFATPRRWVGADAWARDKREMADFANVIVIDADTIEGWMRVTPNAHVWISERLGRRPHHLQTLDQWWQRFRSSTKPPLPYEFFLAGRDAEAEALVRLLGDSDPRVITIESEWIRGLSGLPCGSICESVVGQRSNEDQLPDH